MYLNRMNLIVESSADLISEPTGVSRTSVGKNIIFRGNGINFQQFSEDKQKIIIAEAIPSMIPVNPRRSRLLKLNLQQIKNPDGTINLTGQVARRIKSLILQNPGGRLRQIITDRGHFDLGTLTDRLQQSSIRERSLEIPEDNNLTPGIYQLSNADDTSETTSMAITFNDFDQSQCVNVTDLYVTEFTWNSSTDWQFKAQLVTTNDHCDVCYQDYELLVDDKGPLINNFGGPNDPGATNTFTSADNPRIEINQTNNVAMVRTSNGCPQIQSEPFSAS